MLSYDPLDAQPLEPGAIAPPPPDFQTPPLGEGERPPTPPGWQPEVAVPERPIAQEPRRPHPNFWWSSLWCLLFLFVTQTPGSVLAAVAVAFLALTKPDLLSAGTVSDQAALLKSEPMAAILALVFFVTELLVVGFSWLVLRLVAGRDWTRQTALRRPSGGHLLLTLASFPALVLLGNTAYSLLRNSGRVPSISDSGLFNVVYFWMAVFLVLGAAMLTSLLIAGRGWTRRLAARPTRSTDVLVAVAALAVLLPAIALVYEGLKRALELPGMAGFKIGGMEEMVEVSTRWPWPFAVMVIGMGPGIGEELWCRGFLGRGLVGSYGAVLGVLASSFFFGLIHVDPCQGIMAMVMGLWLHFVYLTTRSLWLPMLLHFLNNSLGVIQPRFPQMAFLDAKPEAIPFLVYAAAGFLLLAVIYALCQSRTRLTDAPGQLALWRPAYAGVEYPPVDVRMQVVHPSPSLPALAATAGGLLLFLSACAFWVRGG